MRSIMVTDVGMTLQLCVVMLGMSVAGPTLYTQSSFM